MAEATKSTSRVEIVPVEFERHPNADSLSITKVFGGYTYVGRTSDWVGCTRAAYIPPDNVVDTERPEFRFLRMKPILDANNNKVGEVEDPSIKTVLVKAKKLRGIISFGLMVPVPNDTPLGEDWTERLGVTHYEPETEEEKKAKGKLNIGGETEQGPQGLNTGSKYDIDAARRYAKECFEQDEPCVVTEKLDGTNCRVVWWNDRLWVKSRNDWKRRQACYDHLTVEGLTKQLIDHGTPDDIAVAKAEEIITRVRSKEAAVNGLWQVVERTEGLVKLCQDNPGTVVFGEIYGNVNKIKYGLPDGNRFAAFDIFRDGKYLDFQEAFQLALNYGVSWVPLVQTEQGEGVQCIPFDFDKLCELAEGKTLLKDAKSGTIREGVVVSPLVERFHPKVGRVKLKFVSGAYLEKHR